MAKEADGRVVYCQEHSAVEEAIKTLKQSDKDQWDAIKSLQNRLPIWATTLISILTFGIGCVSTYAVMLRNMVK